MKITHVITDLNKGGAEFALFRLLKFASENDKSNIHNVISLSKHGFFENEITKLGCNVQSFDFTKNRFNNFIKFYKVIKTQNPDVIQTWMYHSDFLGGLAGRLLRKKNIYWGIHHSNISFKANKLTTFLLFKILSILSYFIPKKIIACSKISIDVHKKIGYKNIFLYSPLGYDFNEFKFNQEKRSEYRNLWKCTDDFFVAGIISRWDKQKDIDNLIGSISLVQKLNLSIKFVIVGKGLDNTNLELNTLINNFNIQTNNLILLGQTNDVQGILSSFDLKILSSRGEAFPNVLAEAMLCERNCISTRVGDVEEILNHTNWLVNKENSKELSEAILSAYSKWKNNNQLYINNGVSNRNYIISNFSISKMYNNYLNFWNK